MGARLTRVISEGELWGEMQERNGRFHKFLLFNAPPEQGVLVSFNEKGIPRHEHEKELHRQEDELLKNNPGYYLFDKGMTRFFGDNKNPNVGIKIYLHYQGII